MSGGPLAGAADRALIARNVAALRRFGWPTHQALAHVAELAPPGPARRLLEHYASALASGGGDDTGDPLLDLLVQGERAGPAALEEAGRGLELELQAREAGAAAFRYACIAMVAGGALLGLFAYGVAPTFAKLYETLGASVPGATRAALTVMAALRYGAPLLVIGAFWFWRRRPWLDRLPGVRGLRTAANLRIYGAAIDAGLDDAAALALVGSAGARDLSRAPSLNLDRLERALVARLLELEGPSVTARVLARELERRSLRRWRLTAMQAPLLILLVTGVVITALVGPLVLPIFTVVGGP